MFSIFMSSYFLQLPSYLKEIIIVPSILVFIGVNFFFKKTRMQKNEIIYLVIILIYSFFGVLNGAPDQYAIRYYIIPAIIFLIVKYEIGEKYNIYFTRFIIYYLFLIFFISIYQFTLNYQLFIDTIISESLFSNLKLNRSYYFFINPNIGGTVIASLVLYIYFEMKNSIFKYFILFFSMFSLIYNFSRSAIFSLILSILFYRILQRRGFFTLVIFLLIAVSFLIFSSNDQGFNMRLDAWINDTIHLINGIGSGIGFVTSSGFLDEYIVFDSDILRFIFEIGIVGLLYFIIFINRDAILRSNKKALAYSVFIIINMFDSDFHSMYPSISFAFICLSLIIVNSKSKDVSYISKVFK